MANRLKQVDYPTEYGTTGNPRKAIVPSYDEASRQSQLTVDGLAHMRNIVYNAASQVTQLTTAWNSTTGRVEKYTYDDQTGLLTRQIVQKVGITEFLDLSYSYDRGSSKGSLSGKTGQLTGIVDNLDANKNRKYEFDAIGRLATAKGGVAAGASGVTANWTQSYTYDRYGNKTGVSASGVDGNNNSVPVDGLSSVTPDSATNRLNVSTWTYDLAGNLIRGQDASGTWQKFEYDAAGRLVKIKDDSNNVLETYTYGADRNRLITETSSQRTYYAWGGQSVIVEYEMVKFFRTRNSRCSLLNLISS